ncbi:MAG: putative transporter [Alphaproteobacteria bacterium]|jgi:putative transport protein
MSLAVLTILCLSVTSFAGIFLGGLKVRGISLGAGGVLFAGLVVGHFLNVRETVLNPEVLAFIREFGLVLFIYSMGLSVGPSIFASLRKNGLILNMTALCVVFVGSVIAMLIYRWGGVSLPETLGLYSGAVTSTPALGAAQQILGELGVHGDEIAKSGLAYAIAYPFTILSSIIVFILLRAAFRVNIADEVAAYEYQKAQDNPQMEAFNVVVNNPNFNGIEIGHFLKMVHYAMAVSRMKRGDEYIVPHEHTKIQVGDILLLFGPKTYFSTISLLFQVDPQRDLMVESASKIQSQTILVTRPSRVGKPLQKIMGHSRHHWVISRVIRNGISLSPQPDLRLAYGDAVVVVGKAVNVLPLVRYLGNSAEAMNTTRFVPFFIGLMLGILIGLIPFYIPGVGVPLKLGAAGGPLVTALLLSYRGSLGHIIFYTPQNVLKAFKELGLILFLAVVGISSGAGFFSLIGSGEGVFLIGMGILITTVPLFLVGAYMRIFKKMNYLTLCGALSGCITSLPSLTFISNMSGTDAAALGYATVYPLTLALRIAAVQAIALLLF